MGRHAHEKIPQPGSLVFFFIKEVLPMLVPPGIRLLPGLWPSFVIMDPRFLRKAQPLFMELE